MGEGYVVSCDRCGFGQHFMVGVGMEYYSLEAVIDLIHPKRRSKVLKLLHECTVHETDYEYRIYRCEVCGNLRSAFWAKIVHDDDEIYETQFLCGECRKPMEQISNPLQLKTKPCPSCGENKLHVAEDMLWD